MFFQSKIRTEAIEANRQFGQIVYGKSGRIGSLARQIGADYACSTSTAHKKRNVHLYLGHARIV